MAQHVTVLGAGAWGTAIAHLLASNGQAVFLWCHEPDVATDINFRHENSYYLPSVELPSSIYATASLEEALVGAEMVFEAVPVMFLRITLEHARQYIHDNQLWVVLSKGIEQNTHYFPSQMINDVFDQRVRIAALGGPNFARELAEKRLSAATIASAAHDPLAAHAVKQVVRAPYFIPYLSDDLLGVQIGGALKNVIALGLGIAHGAQAGDNTRAFIITEGLAELGLFARHYGAQPETVYGLSGLGDLVLTSTGLLSKNMLFGKLLGEGNLFSDISREGLLPEGINTVQSVKQIIDVHGLDLPLMRGIYEFIFNDTMLSDMLRGMCRLERDQG